MEKLFQLMMNKHLKELNPILVGEAEVSPNQVWGPKTIDYYLIHKIIKGKGTLYIRDTVYHLQAGQAFILAPGEIASWVSDSTDPWGYQWVGFTGELAGGFSSVTPVFTAPEGMFSHVNTNLRDPEDTLCYMLAGDLFHLYGFLLNDGKERQDHIRKIVDYILDNFTRDLSIQEIADHVGLNRDYISKLFKKKTGITIQQRISNARYTEAIRYLYMGYPVKEAANLSGFKDVSNFSKQFKRLHGICPKDWKRYDEIRNKNND
ncbi:MAG: AraC family transcriptional regulator [Oscillospiraceae bacterium]|nr:AraC family transcriptional regulator [Oscillospiraceae bacterium]